MGEIWAIRHPVSIWNELEIHQGQRPDEPGLSSLGFQQAFRIARFLSHFPILKLWSSPLPRAMQLALVIRRSRHPPLNIFIEPGLMEITNGVVDGLSYAEIQAKFPDGWDKWHQGVIDQPCFPGGESAKEAAERGVRTLRKISYLSFPLPENHYGPGDGIVIIISHGTLLGLTSTSLMGRSLEEHQTFRQDNGCINFLRWALMGLEVSSVNFTGHLGDTDFSPRIEL